MNLSISIKLAFGIVILSVLGAGAAGFLAVYLGDIWFQAGNPEILSYISLGLGQGIMIIPLFIYLQSHRIPIAQTVRLYPISGTLIRSTIMLSVGLIVVMDEIDRIIQILIPLPDYLVNMGEMLKIDSMFVGIILIMILVVIAPISEELLFRGFLQQILEKSWKDVTRAVLVTSMFFAFIHMNPYWIIQIYLLGVILGYLTWKSGSIVPAIILHMINNGVALFQNNISNTVDSLYSWHGHVSPIWVIIASGLIYLGFIQFHNTIEESS